MSVQLTYVFFRFVGALNEQLSTVIRSEDCLSEASSAGTNRIWAIPANLAAETMRKKQI